ncbi:hypothetical protein LFM09_05500 [Lentzea alba]|uniref:ATP-binding protein n=1 Tax=Lentzea alba TaxID=2714351 RepID=UPI0039BFE4AE
MLVTIRVLGALDVRIGDTAIDIGGPAQQALLALLASTVDAPIPADDIARALWGTRLPARHRQQVQKRVHMLRAKLGAETVTTDAGGYRLSCPTDLSQFTQRLTRARALRLAEDLPAAADAYRSALALWRGPALAGVGRLPDLAAHLDDLRSQAAAEHQELAQTGPAALPPGSRTFVGRSDLLRSLTGPLSVIIGPPGVGKTALAVRWAHDADFPDGKLFLNLHGFGTDSPVTPSEALRELLRALGAHHQQVPRTLDDQVALYRSLLAGKRVLVVLDNAASEDQVRPLLPADPRCAAVVTSRNDLRGLVALNDAHRVPLGVLTEAEACALVTSLTGSSANAAELAHLCGHLPLALRVAATSRAPISDAVTALAAAPLVTTAFEFSYRALPSAAARLFRLLGLVPRPSFTRQAAAALLGTDPSALDVLEHASLVERHRRNSYRMHDLLHAYARDQLTSDERISALPRLLTHYLHTTDAASDLLAPKMTRQPRDTPVTFHSTTDAVAWLDDEHQNVVAAVLSRPHGFTWQLADALRRHLWLTGRADLSVFETGLAVAVEEGDLQGQAAMHHAIGTVRMADDGSLGASDFITAAALFEQAGAQEGHLYALQNLARCHSMRGRFTETLAVLRSASALATTPEQHADVHNSIGMVFTYSGRPAEALRHHEEELHHRGQSEQTVTLPATMIAIAEVTRQLGLLDRASAMIDRLNLLAQDTGALQWRMQALSASAPMARDTGHTLTAIAEVQQLLTLAADPSGLPYEPTARALLGQLHAHQGSATAIAELEHALRLANDLQYTHLAPGMLVDLARVHLASGDLDTAHAFATRALDDARTRDLPVQQGRALVTLAHLGSRDLAAEALDLQRKSGDLLGQAEAHLALGEDAQAAAIFARFTGDPNHAPAGVLTGHPCSQCQA